MTVDFAKEYLLDDCADCPENKDGECMTQSHCFEVKRMAIQALEQTRWIPVSERLPKLCEEVIVTDVETSDTYLSRYIGNEYWECDNGTFKNRIIAWQPKPQPYKSESEEKI